MTALTCTTTVGAHDEARRDGAHAVWLAARCASGEPPSPARIERVRAKLIEPDGLLATASDQAGLVIGMALAEPCRDESGSGAPRAGRGHVSMVFVHPEHQSRGVGSAVLDALIAASPWPRLSLWTRETNLAAHRLYAGRGFGVTSDRGATPAGEPMRRWERHGG